MSKKNKIKRFMDGVGYSKKAMVKNDGGNIWAAKGNPEYNAFMALLFGYLSTYTGNVFGFFREAMTNEGSGLVNNPAEGAAVSTNWGWAAALQGRAAINIRNGKINSLNEELRAWINDNFRFYYQPTINGLKWSKMVDHFEDLSPMELFIILDNIRKYINVSTETEMVEWNSGEGWMELAVRVLDITLKDTTASGALVRLNTEGAARAKINKEEFTPYKPETVEEEFAAANELVTIYHSLEETEADEVDNYLATSIADYINRKRQEEAANGVDNNKMRNRAYTPDVDKVNYSKEFLADEKNMRIREEMTTEKAIKIARMVANEIYELMFGNIPELMTPELRSQSSVQKGNARFLKGDALLSEAFRANKIESLPDAEAFMTSHRTDDDLTYKGIGSAVGKICDMFMSRISMLNSFGINYRDYMDMSMSPIKGNIEKFIEGQALADLEAAAGGDLNALFDKVAAELENA